MSRSVFVLNISSRLNRTGPRSLTGSGIGQAALLVTLACLLLLGTDATAADADTLDFDVGRCHDTLCVWIDLSDLITSDRLNRLKEGVPLSIECHPALSQPRRLWGEETVAEADWSARLSFRPVTEDFVVASAGVEDRVFSSLARLHRFLADSIMLGLAPIDSLNRARFHRVRIKTRLIWLTSLNLSPADDHQGSPVRYLFEQFLSLSGYGRTEFDQDSAPFSLRDLPDRSRSNE